MAIYSQHPLLRRFQGETTHPAYSAMLEVGCAQRTIVLARWLRDRDLQHETESGLNVVENYNGVNDYIRFGMRGELARTPCRSTPCGCRGGCATTPRPEARAGGRSRVRDRGRGRVGPEPPVCLEDLFPNPNQFKTVVVVVSGVDTSLGAFDTFIAVVPARSSWSARSRRSAG
ncbi:transposase [Nonomuraea aurantiaca]|uniref:transposase n=1 Tax=Nonomuraea aurantiaca TaxID=2878562 RepID=UPI001CD9E144|nr:transposase [Nonomuraea aurantiaca]MCA2229601.1 transposase [Nonomuraea aurantiaca]